MRRRRDELGSFAIASSIAAAGALLGPKNGSIRARQVAPQRETVGPSSSIDNLEIIDAVYVRRKAERVHCAFMCSLCGPDSGIAIAIYLHIII
jgi:hypothetical protein